MICLSCVLDVILCVRQTPIKTIFIFSSLSLACLLLKWLASLAVSSLLHLFQPYLEIFTVHSFFYACSTNSFLKINDIYNHPLSGPLHSLANKKGNSLCCYTAYKLSLLEPNELITSFCAFEETPLAEERICSFKSAFNYTYFGEPTDQVPLCCFYL